MRRALWLAGVLSVGCGAGAQVQRPQQTVERFRAALHHDDPERAYNLLDSRLRAEMSYERFLTLWRDNREELKEVAARLARTNARAVGLARVHLQNGDTVRLVLEDGRWYLDGGVMGEPGLRTPLDTVAALRRALHHRDLQALLDVLSRRHRTAWEATFADALDKTRDPLDLDVRIQGNRAVVRTTGGGEIHLQREAGQWRITDIHGDAGN